jgi:hypothetical protein
MPTQIAHDDPTDQESLLRRYGWAAVVYVMFAVLAVLLFLMVR